VEARNEAAQVCICPWYKCLRYVLCRQCLISLLLSEPAFFPLPAICHVPTLKKSVCAIMLVFCGLGVVLLNLVL